MTYSINLLKLLTRRREQLCTLQKAERLRNGWFTFFILLILTLLTYIWTSWIGLGTDPLSGNVNLLSRMDYELHKTWFLIGRAAFSIGLLLGVLFFTSLIYWIFFDLHYKKIVIVQMVVWLVMLIERITWVPIMVYLGLDWFVSPLSFGVMASYFTSIEWLIYFFGCLSVFQIFIIWYQIHCISRLSTSRKWWIITGVLLWNLILYAATAALSYFDHSIVTLLLS
ncbi:hypothetical protein [Halobacillus sp. Marseille-Q1614]|uniref:hypothetical protein n=1 Tax=Halobacillus sp. Marseille-Q1614 TaxID=2709134 RepID=UPI001570AC76|nr:hypothetical protein [Halobacillus sp. Marseille-Q1614]